MYGVRQKTDWKTAWLESVYMAELEIDKEDGHDRKKWRRNVMKRKSNHRQTDYKPIIIMRGSKFVIRFSLQIL